MASPRAAAKYKATELGHKGIGATFARWTAVEADLGSQPAWQGVHMLGVATCGAWLLEKLPSLAGFCT